MAATLTTGVGGNDRGREAALTTLATGQDISERIRRAIFVGRVPKSFTRPGSVLQRSVTSDVSAELARLLGVVHVEEDAPLILGW